MKLFTFTIEEDLTITKNPQPPWEVGCPGTKVQFKLVNQHHLQHTLRMTAFKHVKSGDSLEPVDGIKVWIALGGKPSAVSTHTVQDHGGYDNKKARFAFDVELDGKKTKDPEIVVDEPPSVTIRPRKPPAPATAGKRPKQKQSAAKRRPAARPKPAVKKKRKSAVKKKRAGKR